MANLNISKNCSRRRTDALKFLSCISLDGKYCSTVQNLHVYPNNLLNGEATQFHNLIDANVATEEDIHPKEISKTCYSNQNVKDYKGNIMVDGSFGSDSDNVNGCKSVIDETIFTKSVVSQSTKSKKSTISNGELDFKNKLTKTPRRKKIPNSTGSDLERNYGSSSESICPVTTSRLKTKGLPCKAITESNGKLNVQFIKSIEDHKFNGERIIMVTKKRNPFLVCSIIPYGKSEKHRSDFHKEVLKKRHASRSRPLSTVGDTCNSFELFGIIKSEDGQEVSYGKLLVPTRLLKDQKQNCETTIDTSNLPTTHNRHLMSRCCSYDQGTQRGILHLATSPPINSSKENICGSSILSYNPTLLDDPELIAGKHRTLLTFSSYVTSVIDYVRPCDLKKEINDKFKDKFPHIKLTLSKLRSIKKDMCKIVRTENGSELLTIAQAYVYFEKLILCGLINKQNRKLCAAASLLLSAKLNDFKGDVLKILIERIESVFRLNRREVFEAEFAVLVALEFGLHVPSSEVFPHYQRLLYES